MDPVTAMFQRICRNSAVVGLSKDGAGVGRRGGNWTEDVGSRRLFSQASGGTSSIIRRNVIDRVRAAMCCGAEATRRGRRRFAEDEKLDESPNQQYDRELSEEESLRE